MNLIHVDMILLVYYIVLYYIIKFWNNITEEILNMDDNNKLECSIWPLIKKYELNSLNFSNN